MKIVGKKLIRQDPWFAKLQLSLEKIIIGRPAEAGDLYLIWLSRDAHGECRYFRLKSFMIFVRFILVKYV